MKYHYSCLSKQIFEKDLYALVPIRLEDSEHIRQWRNAQIDILRQTKPLSHEEQKLYFQNVITPLFEQEHPSQLLFSILHEGALIGYGGLTHIRWESRCAEISFLLDPAREDLERDFSDYLQLLSHIAFVELKLRKLVTETYAFRTQVIAILEKSGFQLEGRLRQHVFKKKAWWDSLVHAFFAPQFFGDTLPGILVTSISKKVPLIQAVREAAYRTESYGWIHGCDADDTCIGKHFVDRFWHCPHVDNMTLDTIVNYCKEHRITAIIPTRDDDLLFYAHHHQALKEQGINVMVSPEKTVKVCQDKLLFSQISLPVIPSSFEPEYDSLVVKERFGAGTHNTVLNVTRDIALQQAKKLKHPLFQPYIEGTEYTVDCYITQDGALRGCIVRVRALVVNGESQVTTTCRHKKIEQLCKDLAASIPFYGHILFQVIEDEHQNVHIVECNPRFGGASTASIAAGLDSFYWFLSRSEHPFQPKPNLTQIRHQQDRILQGKSHD